MTDTESPFFFSLFFFFFGWGGGGGRGQKYVVEFHQCPLGCITPNKIPLTTIVPYLFFKVSLNYWELGNGIYVSISKYGSDTPVTRPETDKAGLSSRDRLNY